MAVGSRSRERGFTLVELMIVVAIIGVLASVAIPSFRNYQLTSKRVEAYSNLAALAKAQKSYFAEFNEFHAAAPEPSATTGLAPNSTKRPVADLSAAFGPVGWTPEGDVFFDYDTITPMDLGAATVCAPSTCQACFTATAYGNLDDSSLMSEFVFFHPDQNGNWCPVGVSGKGPPIDPVSGITMWDMAVHHPNSDRF